MFLLSLYKSLKLWKVIYGNLSTDQRSGLICSAMHMEGLQTPIILDRLVCCSLPLKTFKFSFFLINLHSNDSTKTEWTTEQNKWWKIEGGLNTLHMHCMELIILSQAAFKTEWPIFTWSSLCFPDKSSQYESVLIHHCIVLLLYFRHTDQLMNS